MSFGYSKNYKANGYGWHDENAIKAIKKSVNYNDNSSIRSGSSSGASSLYPSMPSLPGAQSKFQIIILCYIK